MHQLSRARTLSLLFVCSTSFISRYDGRALPMCLARGRSTYSVLSSGYVALLNRRFWRNFLGKRILIHWEFLMRRTLVYNQKDQFKLWFDDWSDTTNGYCFRMNGPKLERETCRYSSVSSELCSNKKWRRSSLALNYCYGIILWR